jgi:hypothetical protein
MKIKFTIDDDGGYIGYYDNVEVETNFLPNVGDLVFLPDDKLGELTDIVRNIAKESGNPDYYEYMFPDEYPFEEYNYVKKRIFAYDDNYICIVLSEQPESDE